MQTNIASLRLRTKAAIIVGLILVLVLGLNSFFTSRLLVRELRRGLEMKASVLGGLLVKDIRKVLDFGLGLKDLEDASKRCEELVLENPELALALVVDAAGTAVFHSNPALVGRPAGDILPAGASEAREALSGTTRSGEETVYTTVLPDPRRRRPVRRRGRARRPGIGDLGPGQREHQNRPDHRDALLRHDARADHALHHDTDRPPRGAAGHGRQRRRRGRFDPDHRNPDAGRDFRPLLRLQPHAPQPARAAGAHRRRVPGTGPLRRQTSRRSPPASNPGPGRSPARSRRSRSSSTT